MQSIWPRWEQRGRPAGTAGKKNALAIGSVAGVTALDVWCASRLSKAGAERAGARAEASLLVSRLPEECYRFWRNFENLPRFIDHLKSVRSTGDLGSRWTAYGPGGIEVEWNAEVEEDIPNKRLAWRARAGSHIWHSGVVDFENAPGGRGTIVRVQMDYGNTLKAIGLYACGQKSRPIDSKATPPLQADIGDWRTYHDRRAAGRPPQWSNLAGRDCEVKSESELLAG